MNFWQLTSIFKSEREMLESTLNNPRWEKYYQQYIVIKSILDQQDRVILDEVIPFELAKTICQKSKLEVYLYYQQNPPLLITQKTNSLGKHELLRAEEVFIRFGSTPLEDLLENGRVQVYPKPLHGKVEVLGAYNLTNLGVLAILRSELYPLPAGMLLSSPNGAMSWDVHKEANMLITPYAAHQKRESQRDQGIGHYLITPISLPENTKPIEGELLVIQSVS